MAIEDFPASLICVDGPGSSTTHVLIPKLRGMVHWDAMLDFLLRDRTLLGKSGQRYINKKSDRFSTSTLLYEAAILIFRNMVTGLGSDSSDDIFAL